MNIFDAVGQILNSTTTVFVTTATTMEKTVKLVEREVDNLTIEQQIRLDAINAEQTAKLAKLNRSINSKFTEDPESTTDNLNTEVA